MMYALSSSNPVARVVSIVHNQVTSVTSCAITGNILAVHHNRCWLLQPESPLATGSGVVLTIDRTRYIPFLEFELDETPIATAVCNTHLALQTSPREVALYRWHVHPNQDDELPYAEAANGMDESNANEDCVDFSEATIFEYNPDLQLPVKECNNLTLFLPGVERMDTRNEALDLLGPLEYVLSRLVTFYHVLSRLVTSYHVLSRLITSYHVLSLSYAL